jgi:hypothetical protein
VQVNLRNSLSSTSVFSTSTASSGVPGIGYISGRAVKWVGMQILDAFVPLEICRRRWVIRRLVKRIKTIPIEECAEWLVRKEPKIMQAVDNLLELSSYVFSYLFCRCSRRFISRENYKRDYRTTAINQGIFLKEIIEGSMFALSSESQTKLSSMAVKVFPL